MINYHGLAIGIKCDFFQPAQKWFRILSNNLTVKEIYPTIKVTHSSDSVPRQRKPQTTDSLHDSLVYVMIPFRHFPRKINCNLVDRQV